MAKQAKTFKGTQDMYGVTGVRGTSVGGTFSMVVQNAVSNALGKQASIGPKVHKKKPKASEGTDGDQRLVKEGNDNYMYTKMNGKWLKMAMNITGEAQVTSASAASTEGGSESTSPGDSTSVQFKVALDQGEDAGNQYGWSTYLAASKETDITPGQNGQILNTTERAHESFSNGEVMREGSAVTSDLWTPWQLVEGSSPNYQYFPSSNPSGYLFKVAWNGLITGVRSRTPNTLGIAGVVDSASQVTLTLTGNTELAETARFYYKTNAASTWTEVNENIASNNRVANHEFTKSIGSLSANTLYNFKVEERNTASSFNVGQQSDTLNLTTNASAASWQNVPADFTIVAIGFGETVGEFETAYKTIDIANGTAASNSTTVSLVKDSGDAHEFGVALSTTGDPGLDGTGNSGTGYATSRSVNLGNGTLYMRFRHRYKSAFEGNDANISVTFSNTLVALADDTSLDITMVNGGQ